MKGKFITLEGCEGVGKSTQLRLLLGYLDQNKIDYIYTREPGGTEISEKIRNIILDKDNVTMSAECEALLYAASRVEHVREVILPALNAGKFVICDRFLDSSIAYQAYGRELGEDFIRLINKPATDLAFPEATLLLELDRERAKKRLLAGAPADRLESEREDFFDRVRRGYEAVKAAEPNRVKPIDASRTIDEVFASVRAAIEAVL